MLEVVAVEAQAREGDSSKIIMGRDCSTKVVVVGVEDQQKSSRLGWAFNKTYRCPAAGPQRLFMSPPWGLNNVRTQQFDGTHKETVDVKGPSKSSLPGCLTTKSCHTDLGWTKTLRFSENLGIVVRAFSVWQLFVVRPPDDKQTFDVRGSSKSSWVSSFWRTHLQNVHFFQESVLASSCSSQEVGGWLSCSQHCCVCVWMGGLMRSL